MKKTMLLTGLFALLLVLPQGPAAAQDERELRAQRSEAHKARNEERRLRSRQLADAARELRDYARELEPEYKRDAEEVDTAFQLEEVKLEADSAARIARVKSEFQKEWTSAILGQGAEPDPARVQAIEAKAKAYGDQLFTLRRQAAEEVHRAREQAYAKKDGLRDALDEKVLERAAQLGLARDYVPIQAQAIGGELTRQEEQWNQREEKEIAKIAERNAKLLSPYRNGKRLREWERANREEDFRLKWEEEAELHGLNVQHEIYSGLLQPAQVDAAAGQSMMERAAERAEQERLIQIRFQQIRRENSIKRRDEKKRILGA